MMNCNQARENLHRYVDGELPPAAQMALEAHLIECAACLEEYESVRQVVDVVRGAKPLFQPPAELRERLAEMIAREAHPAEVHFPKRRRSLLLAATAVAAALPLIALLPVMRPAAFTSFAAEAHLRHRSGMLPLDLASTDRGEINAWLRRQVPFPLVLPAETGGGQASSLRGARLLRYGGRNTAFLAYELNSHRISLMVGDDIDLHSTGARTYRAGQLEFHFLQEENLKLITWKDHGLSYALVTDGNVSGTTACVICHESAAEQRKFRSLPSSDHDLYARVPLFRLSRDILR